MNQKTFNTLAGLVFAVVGALHLLRILFRWDAVINGWTAPMWVSVLAVIVAGYLALSAFKLRK